MPRCLLWAVSRPIGPVGPALVLLQVVMSRHSRGQRQRQTEGSVAAAVSPLAGAVAAAVLAVALSVAQALEALGQGRALCDPQGSAETAAPVSTRGHLLTWVGLPGAQAR